MHTRLLYRVYVRHVRRESVSVSLCNEVGCGRGDYDANLFSNINHRIASMGEAIMLWERKFNVFFLFIYSNRK